MITPHPQEIPLVQFDPQGNIVATADALDLKDEVWEMTMDSEETLDQYEYAMSEQVRRQTYWLKTTRWELSS